MNLDAILRIKANVTGADAVQSLGRAVGAVGKAADGAKASFKNVVSSSSWQAAAAAAAGVGVALGTSVKAAIDFESSIADVRKVVDGINTPQGLKAIRTEILDLSKQMPITAEGFAQIYAAAGESGIARGEIREFAKNVAQMAVAFDMTAEEAGNAMAKLRSALGLSQPDVVKLADAMNYLSNNTASTASQLTNFVLRSGAVGQMTGLSAQQTAAFGAAMIGAGIETEVAATSFNNMVKALTRGSSMTERQESALRRLGMASGVVTRGERDMTSEVQRQSDRRLQIMQDASDRQQGELRKRYRRQLQLLQDQWDDESEAFDDGIRDQTDAQIKALQRQADARIKALQQQAGDNQAFADQQAQVIRDQLDNEIDAIRDAADRTLKLDQRARRDRQQEARDGIEERMETELKGMQRGAQEREKAEQESTKKILDAAKASAGEGGSEAGKALAEAMQRDALGTIQDVFARIKNLAPAERISVISDLFGDEARGLAPMIQNLGGLEKALSLVGDETKYAGSMLKEYDARSQTTANALQLAQNNFQALQITIGERLIPAIVKLIEMINPVVAAFTRFADANPQIATVTVAVVGLLAAFVALAPFIVATISLLSSMAPVAAGVAATIAGWAGIIVPVLTTIGGALAATFAIIASAPVLVTLAIAAAVAAVVAGVVLFRNEIGSFFVWLGNAAMEGWRQLTAPVQPLVDALVEYWTGAATVFYQLFIEPIVKSSQYLWGLITQGWNAVSGVASRIFSAIANAYQNIVVKPLVGAWTKIVDTAKAALRGLLGWAASAINGVINMVNRIIDGINAVRRLAGLSTFGRVGNVTVPAFAQGGYVTGPTLGLVGEAGREYIVPESKAAGFANNIMAGRRGAAAIPSGTSSSGGSGSVQVNITTGPVRQDASGQRWMTIEDGERMVRQAAAQLQRTSRTPGGRYASGVR